MDYNNGKWTTKTITGGQGSQKTDYSATAGTGTIMGLDGIHTTCSTCMTTLGTPMKTACPSRVRTDMNMETGGIPVKATCPTCVGTGVITETVGIPMKTTCPTLTTVLIPMRTTGGIPMKTTCPTCMTAGMESETEITTETGMTTEKESTIEGNTDYGTCTCQDVENENSVSKK